MSTPFGKRGFFYEVWTNGGPEWTRIKATVLECDRIPPDFIEEERKALGDRWFRQEYLCEFLATEDMLFDIDIVRARFTDDVQPMFPGGVLWQ